MAKTGNKKSSAGAGAKRGDAALNATASTKSVKVPQKRFARLRKVARWAVIVCIVLAILPLILTVIYRAESVRPVSTIMLARYATLQPVMREWRSIDQISERLAHSILMSEDGQFCAHDGVDWGALNTVIEDAIDGQKTRGASTVTMQLAKNLFLWPQRSFIRKGLEVPLAMWIDFVLPKRRILEIYMNIAEWDEGVFGAASATRVYFNKDAKALTRRQAALLATTLPNPKRRNAAKPSRRHAVVARIVERRARAAGAYVKCLAEGAG